MTIKGQILADSLFANSINNTIKTYMPKTIVEIGTWKGLGSTKRIIEAIMQYKLESNFISLETNKKFYDEAKYNLDKYTKYINLIYGRIIDQSDIFKFLDLSPIINTEFFTIEQQISWLEADIESMNQCPNVIRQIPSNIDFLLLDGGEFSTYAEWKLLKDRSKVIALDDTRTQKCKYIKLEIMNNQNKYNVLIDSDDRNGFMIIENRNNTCSGETLKSTIIEKIL
jgi:hypothetical protein